MTGWRERAFAMKAADPERSNASIARELGVGAPAVWKALNPERFRESDRRTRDKRRARRQEIDREYSRRTRSVCEVCGGPCGIGSGHASRRSARCAACTSAIHETRLSIVAGMYLAGWPIRDMESVLYGSSRSRCGKELDELRRLGWIGWRYANTKRQVAT